MIRILPIFMLIVIGCNSQKAANDQFYDLTTTVTINGRPADRIRISFTPVVPGIGRDDVCFVTGGKMTIKLIAGKYKVGFTSVPLTGNSKVLKSNVEEINMDKDVEQAFELR